MNNDLLIMINDNCSRTDNLRFIVHNDHMTA